MTYSVSSVGRTRRLDGSEDGLRTLRRASIVVRCWLVLTRLRSTSEAVLIAHRSLPQPEAAMTRSCCVKSVANGLAEAGAALGGAGARARPAAVSDVIAAAATAARICTCRWWASWRRVVPRTATNGPNG